MLTHSEPPWINARKKVKPTEPCNNIIFSFAYTSLKRKQLCLNFDKIPTKGYHKLFEKLKIISGITYKELGEGIEFHKFHPVIFCEDLEFTKHQYKKYLTDNTDGLKDDQLPTLYQFKIYEEKRVFGFLGYNGLFYILLYDF